MEYARASYRGRRPYKAVIKVGKKIVWECPHWHRNRDQTTLTSGISACDCGSTIIRAIETKIEGREPVSKWAGWANVNPYRTDEIRRDRNNVLFAESVVDQVLEAIKQAGGEVKIKEKSNWIP